MNRFGRVNTASGPAWARLEGDTAVLLDGPPWSDPRETGQRMAKPELLVPVAPSKIVGIGRNYRAHAKELGNPVPTEPLLFLKPPSALTSGRIPYPADAGRVDYEAEVVIVIGRRAHRVSEVDAAKYIYGVTLGVDVTARELQQKDRTFARAKGFDGFCPIGPAMAPLDPSDLHFGARLNGVEVQNGHTRDMIFAPAALIAYVSRIMTLEPGDVILSGTPEGVGPLKPGDVLEVHADGVGTLLCAVVPE